MSFLEEKIRFQALEIRELRKENKALRKKADAFDAARAQLREHAEPWMTGVARTHISTLCISLADQMDAIAKGEDE